MGPSVVWVFHTDTTPWRVPLLCIALARPVQLITPRIEVSQLKRSRTATPQTAHSSSDGMVASSDGMAGSPSYPGET